MPAPERTISAAARRAARRSPWFRCYDEQSGCHYMFNETTGESVWETPSAGAERRRRGAVGGHDAWAEEVHRQRARARARRRRGGATRVGGSSRGGRVRAPQQLRAQPGVPWAAADPARPAAAS